MKRSVMARNFTGGFLGGVSGILVSWYFAPTMLPFGVLLGVVAGWWTEDIAQAFVNSCHKAYAFWQAIKARIVPKEIHLPHQNFFQHFRRLLRLCMTKLGNKARYVLGWIIAPFRWISIVFCWFGRTLKSTARWASHPTGKATLISIFAITIGATITALAIGMYFPWPEMKTIGGGMSKIPKELVLFEFSDVVTITSLMVLFLTMFGAIGTFLPEFNEDDSTRSFYLRWERYSRHSPVVYFILELVQFFKSMVWFVGLIIFGVAYWATLGGVLIALVTVPVTIFALFMASLYRIAQRSAHWQCFGVTLVTTAISAIVFHDNFGNEAVLWTVALSTGVASGLLTEGLRQLGIWWGDTKMGFHYLNISYDESQLLPFSIATPAWRKLSEIFDSMSQRTIPLITR